MELRGTFTKPEGSGLPAVLLLPGSGPTDRNGNQPPQITTDLLKEMADGLASVGIASLRFDKRAVGGYSASWPKAVADIDKFFRWENFVADAKAGLVFLQKQEGIDPKRTAIVGHSEGGSLAIKIGSDLSGKPGAPKALVLMGTPGRTFDPIIREQVSASLGRAKLSADQIKKYLDYVDAALTQVREKGTFPPNPPEGLGPIFNPTAASLIRSYVTVDPIPLVKRFTGPVLILQGEKDIQISPARDAAALAAALKARGGDHELLTIAGASHNFKLVVDPDKEPGFTGPMAKEALDKLKSWLQKYL